MVDMIAKWKGFALIVRHFRFHNVPARLGYSAFVPLDAGESFTYIIEVRAVEEKLSYIGATGYFFSHSRLNVWLDDWETLTHQDREERVAGLRRAFGSPRAYAAISAAKTPECLQAYRTARVNHCLLITSVGLNRLGVPGYV